MYSKHLKQFSILGSRIYHSNVLLKQASSSSVLLSKNVSKGNSELSHKLTSLTSPQWRASSAEMSFPVSNREAAVDGPTKLGRK